LEEDKRNRMWLGDDDDDDKGKAASCGKVVGTVTTKSALITK
jgi:hypothetical protein